MLKRVFVVLSLIPFSIFNCDKNEVKEDNQIVREETPSIEVDELPVVEIDEDNEIEEKDYKKIPSYIYLKLASFSSYKAVTKGKTNAFIVTQNIDALVIKGEYSYLRNDSHSSLVNTTHEAYYHEKEALYRDSESGEYTLSDISSYLNIYGTYPFDTSLEGYLISEEHIKSVTKISHENSTYTFNVVFDEVTSTNNVKIQMKKFGGLSDYPTFSLIEMNLTFKEDFTLESLSLHSKYKAKTGLITANCEQNYVVSYSNYNEYIEIANLETIKPLFSK